MQVKEFLNFIVSLLVRIIKESLLYLNLITIISKNNYRLEREGYVIQQKSVLLFFYNILLSGWEK